MLLNTSNWYWTVAGKTDVYSSARNIYVPTNDPDYVAWSAQNTSSSIINEAEIWPYVSGPPRSLPAWLFNGTTFAQPTATTYTKPQLAAYAADVRYRRASGGLTVTSLNSVSFLTDPVARNTLANANEYAKVTPHNTDWKFSDGTFKVLTPTQLTTAANAMANFVQACFTCESATVSNINGGITTTLSEIDAAFNAVANVVP